MAFLKGTERLANWSSHTQIGRQEWMNQLPRHVFAKSPKTCACQDRKIIEPKLDNTQCGFCQGRSTAEQISTLQQIWEILGACQRHTKHMFCRPRESVRPVSLWKALDGVVGVRCWWVSLCWQSSDCIPAQKIVSVLTELITTVQRWYWTPTMVCAVTTSSSWPISGFSKQRPGTKLNLRSHFTRPQNTFRQ